MQGPPATSSTKDLRSLQALEAQVVQLHSRLAFMEEEKTRLVAAAKGKNEQVRTHVQTCLEAHASRVKPCCAGFARDQTQ